MSASTGALARLLAEAYEGQAAISGDEACLDLYRLAPDAVRLLTDMAAWIDGTGGMADGEALLARFAALEQEAAQ